jgi:hypothetical protein
MTPMCCDDSTEKTLMLFKNLAVTVAQPLKHPCRALDIREQNRDDPCGQLGHYVPSVTGADSRTGGERNILILARAALS